MPLSKTNTALIISTFVFLGLFVTFAILYAYKYPDGTFKCLEFEFNNVDSNVDCIEEFMLVCIGDPEFPYIHDVSVQKKVKYTTEMLDYDLNQSL